jgi:hypothetical protein
MEDSPADCFGILIGRRWSFKKSRALFWEWFPLVADRTRRRCNGGFYIASPAFRQFWPLE